MEERDDFVTVSICGPVAAVAKLMERCILGAGDKQPKKGNVNEQRS